MLGFMYVQTHFYMGPHIQGVGLRALDGTVRTRRVASLGLLWVASVIRELRTCSSVVEAIVGAKRLLVLKHTVRDLPVLIGPSREVHREPALFRHGQLSKLSDCFLDGMFFPFALVGTGSTPHGSMARPRTAVNMTVAVPD